MKNSWVINNQYIVIGEIGLGGFATVYRAWDIMLQKIVAIKKIHKEYSQDAKYVDMFRREAVNTAKLEQDNIVRVVNFLRDTDGSFCIVMDYVFGVDLEYLIEKCKRNSVEIPEDISLHITSEVLRALDYAHSVKDIITQRPLRIIHRDITPGNVMIYFDGRVKLTDFGIAKAGEHQIITGKKDTLKGKISYMSPEQAEGRYNIDNRSDLFSCGLILFELLAGEKAFDGKDDMEILSKVKSVSIDFKLLKKRGISKEVMEIVKKILVRSPDKRYRAAAEIFLDIRRYFNKSGHSGSIEKVYKDFTKDILARENEDSVKELEKDFQQDFRAILRKK